MILYYVNGNSGGVVVWLDWVILEVFSTLVIL